MPCGAVGRVVAEVPVSLVSRLTADPERVSDLGPRRTPIPGAGNEHFELILGDAHGIDLTAGLDQGVGLVALGAFHTRQDILTASLGPRWGSRHQG